MLFRLLLLSLIPLLLPSHDHDIHVEGTDIFQLRDVYVLNGENSRVEVEDEHAVKMFYHVNQSDSIVMGCKVNKYMRSCIWSHKEETEGRTQVDNQLMAKNSSSNDDDEYHQIVPHHNMFKQLCQFTYSKSMRSLVKSRCSDKAYEKRMFIVGEYNHHECAILLRRVELNEGGEWKCEVKEYKTKWNIFAKPKIISHTFNVEVVEQKQRTDAEQNSLSYNSKGNINQSNINNTSSSDDSDGENTDDLTPEDENNTSAFPSLFIDDNVLLEERREAMIALTVLSVLFAVSVLTLLTFTLTCIVYYKRRRRIKKIESTELRKQFIMSNLSRQKHHQGNKDNKDRQQQDYSTTRNHQKLWRKRRKSQSAMLSSGDRFVPNLFTMNGGNNKDLNNTSSNNDGKRSAKNVLAVSNPTRDVSEKALSRLGVMKYSTSRQIVL